ncbi:MAG: ribonuclease III [Gammaproteobacteria bacterium]|nr:ribonuclease III [Gammaproteobacteria bacterium]
MTRLDWAERHLKYRFKDADLLQQALTHRSASKRNNERLEFLGDAFLNFAIAQRLYELRSEASEGDLSRLRAFLVRGTTLAEIARPLGLEQQLVLGPGELRSGGGRRESVLANGLEALIGAILLDGGTEAARDCIDVLFAERLETLPVAETLKDAKTRLQEWLQARGHELPDYTVESAVGEPHEKTFTVVCSAPADGRSSRGSGSSRRKAEQDAAEKLLANLIDEER